MFYLFNKLLGIFGSSQISGEHAAVPIDAKSATRTAAKLENNFILFLPSLFFFIYYYNSYNYYMVVHITYK